MRREKITEHTFYLHNYPQKQRRDRGEIDEMRAISLFAGIGGFESGLAKACPSAEVVFSSEIDKFARESYKAIYEVYPAGDITKIHTDDIPDHDLLMAGFPCQAFSLAGKRGGFADTRGTLFFEVARIAKEKRPKILLLENVKGLLSHDGGKTFQTIITTLNELDYTIDFSLLNSKFFNVAQSRERLFIVGVLDKEPEKWQIEKGNNILSKTKKKLDKQGVKAFNFAFPKQEKVNVKLKDMLETSVDEKYYINKPLSIKVPGAEEISGTVRAGGRGSKDRHTWDLVQVGELKTMQKEANKRVYSTNGLSPTLTAMTGGGREPKIITKLVFPEYGQQGNVHETEGIASTLLATQYKNPTKIFESQRVRRITPLEAWRLQGFTDEQFNKAKAAKISDTQLYKQAGNAVTVNVIEAIVKQLISEGYLYV